MREKEASPELAAALERTFKGYPLKQAARKAYPWTFPVDMRGEFDPQEARWVEDQMEQRREESG